MPPRGETLQAGGDVDPFAEQVRAVNNDVPNVHADAEAHWFRVAGAGLFRSDGILHRDRAADSIDCTREVGDDAIASGVENAAAISCDQPIDDEPTRLEPGKRADFIKRHKSAVTGNISGEDRGQLPFNGRSRHGSFLPREVYRA